MQTQAFASYFKSEFSCMSVKFSPFEPMQLALSCCDNFGVVGKGKLVILNMVPNQTMQVVKIIEEHDALFDCAWTEFDKNLIVSGCGDGEVKLWDIATGKIIMSRRDHKSEVQSVDCNSKDTNLFLSSGMDGTVRLYDFQSQQQIQVFQTHKGTCYQAVWHPVQATIFATAGLDGALRLWDLKQQGNKNIASIKAHQGEILSCDFNKYEEIIATASNDKSIRLWDLRNLKTPFNILQGHRYPVRRIKFSPHESNVLASASYDMQAIIWNTQELANPILHVHGNHTEFVVGVDFSLHIPKLFASAGWDGRCLTWSWDQPQPKIQ